MNSINLILSVAMLLISTVIDLYHVHAEDRVISFNIDSPHQPTAQRVRIVMPGSVKPDRSPKGDRVRVIYVLPVEAGPNTKWGDPRQACRDAKVFEKHSVILVFPEFAQLPWYADHPTDKHIAQESFFIESVIPAVEARLEIEETKCDRYLLGFSKSGWGAFTLLLRHPDLFLKASAWDAPLMMDKPGNYGSGPIFETTQNFEKYQVSRLLKSYPFEKRGVSPRLISLGYDNFREHHLKVHNLMMTLKIPHIHKDGPKLKHHWESGWVKNAVDLLLAEPPQ